MASLTLLRRTDRFAPSRDPYWFDVDNVTDGRLVAAVWAGRKHGRTTITLGTYRLHPAHMSWQEDFGDFDPLAMITRADTRYGGNWAYRFDGVRHLTEPTAAAAGTEAEQEARRWLEDMLAGLPDSLAAAGWAGPFVRAEVDLTP